MITLFVYSSVWNFLTRIDIIFPLDFRLMSDIMKRVLHITRFSANISVCILHLFIFLEIFSKLTIRKSLSRMLSSFECLVFMLGIDGAHGAFCFCQSVERNLTHANLGNLSVRLIRYTWDVSVMSRIITVADCKYLKSKSQFLQFLFMIWNV